MSQREAEVEVERLRADVRAAYAERDEMWERKTAALQRAGRAEAERDALQVAAEQARALHVANSLGECTECFGSSPCPTLHALNGPESPATAPAATS